MTIEIIEKLKIRNVELEGKLGEIERSYHPQILKEIAINKSRIERLEAGKSVLAESKSILADTLTKLNKIQEKNKCARVRFLDWTASKIMHYGTIWSTRIQTISNRIDSPCVIKMGDTK